MHYQTLSFFRQTSTNLILNKCPFKTENLQLENLEIKFFFFFHLKNALFESRYF